MIKIKVEYKKQNIPLRDFISRNFGLFANYYVNVILAQWPKSPKKQPVRVYF